LVITLQRAAGILLNVVDHDTGAPITDATVTGLRQVYERDGPVPLQVASEPAALAAAGVPPPYEGLYLLTPAGTLGNTAVVSAPGHATRGYVLPTVTAPDRATFRAKLPREARAGGVVVDEKDQPIASATVKLVPPESLRVDLEPVTRKTDGTGR